MSSPDAADVTHFTSLSGLTHLDLGYARGVVALAPRLPNLQSLALYIPESDSRVSAALPSAAEALGRRCHVLGACYCLASMCWHGLMAFRCTPRNIVSMLLS